MIRDALVWGEGQVKQRRRPQGKLPVSSSLDSVVYHGDRRKSLVKSLSESESRCTSLPSGHVLISPCLCIISSESTKRSLLVLGG